MIIFSLILALIIYILWKNTNVYGVKEGRWGYYDIDYSKRTPLEFTWLHLIGLALLFIPWFNIVWFIILIAYYIKRAAENEDGTDEDDIFYRPNGVAEFITNIYNILNRKI